MDLLAQGELMVVETEDDWYLGVVEVRSEGLVVRIGHRGHPKLIRFESVVRVNPWAEMPEALID